MSPLLVLAALSIQPFHADETEKIQKALDAAKDRYGSMRGVEEASQMTPRHNGYFGNSALKPTSANTRVDVCTWVAKDDKCAMDWTKNGIGGREINIGDTTFVKILSNKGPYDTVPTVTVWYQAGNLQRDLWLQSFGLKYAHFWIGDLLRDGTVKVAESRNDDTWGKLVTLRGEKEGVVLRFDLAVDKDCLAVLSTESAGGEINEFVVLETEKIAGHLFPKKGRMLTHSVGHTEDPLDPANAVYGAVITAKKTETSKVEDSEFEMPKLSPGFIVWDTVNRKHFKVGDKGERIELEYR